MITMRAMTRRLGAATVRAGAFVFFPVIVSVLRKRHRTLIWAGAPLINLKYWASAMREIGSECETLVSSTYVINARADYDLLYEDVVPRWIPSAFRKRVAPYAAFFHIVAHASIVHISFEGGPLGTTPVWRQEARLLRRAGIRTVVIPYGADAFIYSRVPDLLIRHGLLLSYPLGGRYEDLVEERVRYWSRVADVVVADFALEVMPRWDVLVSHVLSIDTTQWRKNGRHSTADARTAKVRVLHAPNHRGAKGTEFVVAAIEDLRADGLDVELVLAERMPNDEIRKLMSEVDVLVDQLLLPYGLTAVEAMAMSLPVVSNLADPALTTVFDIYSSLGECPVVAATPATVTQTLRALVTEPGLRKQLGRAGRGFVAKYRSYDAARHLFGSIHTSLRGDPDVELGTLFHPILSEYNKRSPRVEHPLVNHRLPPERG